MATSKRAASRRLAPKEALRLWNGDRAKALSIAFPEEDWTRVRERIAELGLPSLSRYVEALIEMDVSANAVEVILEKVATFSKSSEAPISQIADLAGLPPDLVLRLRRDGKQEP